MRLVPNPKALSRQVLLALTGLLSSLYAASAGIAAADELVLTGRTVAFACLSAAAILVFAGLAASLYAARLSARISDTLNRLADGDYSARLTGCPGWLKGVSGSLERLARSTEEIVGHNRNRQEEAAMLRQQSSCLEERLTSANADLSDKDSLLKDVNRELISANKAKAEFISRMGRELRLPLNTIIGFSDFVLQGTLGPINERQREYIEKIRGRADTLLDLENNIVEYSMLDSMEPSRFIELNPRDIAAEVAESIAPYARAADVFVKVDVPDEAVKADKNKLRHILYNLLHNSVKFNVPGGSSTLTARILEPEQAREKFARAGMECTNENCPSSIEFVVEDTGIGIPPDRYGELFTPFSQISDGTGRKTAGAGLSLFLVRKFAEQHGGCVWIEARDEGGSRFHVLLPCTPSTAPAAIRGRKKVMIVEDDPEQMKLVTIFLSGGSYDIIGVDNGLKALKVLEEETPDIILLDVMLPGMNGIEVCWAVKRQENFRGLNRIPVIIMTSRTDMENKLNAIRAGADDVIFKPVDKRLLVERVKALLESREELESVMASYKELEKEALVDPLTGLFNRRYLDDVIAREFLNSRRYGRNLSVLMMDLDNFKAYNDMFGHLDGDELLSKASSIFVDSVREVDFVARYGGEEFMVVMPETPPDLAMVAAERIRTAIEKGTAITLSIGLASFPDDAGELSELMKNADAALYKAKHMGRNRTATFKDCCTPEEDA